MIFFLFFLSVFAASLSEPEVRTFSKGIVVTLHSENEVSIRLISMDSGCLYIFTGVSFVQDGILDSPDERIHFFQKKNLLEDAQLLIGFSNKWTCFSPTQTAEQIFLRIGESSWNGEDIFTAPIKEASKEQIAEPLQVQEDVSSKRDKPFLIAIDAGHGGWDNGAVGNSGLKESDVVLSMALRLATRLKGKGFSILLIRDSDIFVPLKDRALIANQANADLFISLHANAAPTSELFGIETFSMDIASDEGAKKVAKRENTLVKMDTEQLDNLKGSLVMQGAMKLSKTLAKMVQKHVMHTVQSSYGEIHTRDLGAKTALFYVLVYTKMPSILFEASFLSNPEDERMLRTPHFHDTLMEGMAKAVEEYFHIQE